MRARYLFIVSNDRNYDPRDKSHILGLLKRFFTTPNIRIGSKHVEIEIWDPDLSIAMRVIEENVGGIIDLRRIDGPEDSNVSDSDLIEAYVDLFNQERFWEAHGALEALWRRSGDRNAQGLILVAAAFTKIQEGKEHEFVIIAKKALEMLGNVRYFCIDLVEVKKRLFFSLENKRPFRIECTASLGVQVS